MFRVKNVGCYGKESGIMAEYIDIPKLYNELENQDPEGGYCSRATIFGNALRNGKISEEVYKKAREYYGRLWNYTGD